MNMEVEQAVAMDLSSSPALGIGLAIAAVGLYPPVGLHLGGHVV